MALFAKQFSLYLLISLFLSSHARESQFFNKASATTNNDVVSYTKQPETSPQPDFISDNTNDDVVSYTKQSKTSPHPDFISDNTNNDVVSYTKQSTTNPQPDFILDNTNNDVVSYTKQPETSPQPDFLPDNQNGHGLYGQDSGRLPSSATYRNKHLPKNYNPVAYVTQPDDINDSAAFTEDKNNFYGGAQNYYIAPEDKQPEYRNSYYNGGANGFERQGMSDTRFVENGKYYYDVENEKYNSNHPYESLKRSNVRNGYGFNGGKNSIGGYENNQYDEENNNWRP